jgi:hypothetical protein
MHTAVSQVTWGCDGKVKSGGSKEKGAPAFDAP